MMLALTRKADYALVALGGLAVIEGGCASARELSERFRLPLPLLRNLLKDLAHAGLLASEQGARGGYRLTRRPERITVADVVEAIEGRPRLAPCCSPTGGGAAGPSCQLEASCLIKAGVRRLHERLGAVLAGLTLAELIELGRDEVVDAGVRRSQSQTTALGVLNVSPAELRSSLASPGETERHA